MGLLCGALALLLSSLTGFALYRLLRRRGLPLICFEHALSGLALLVSVFAVLQTGGMSVLLPAPLLVAGIAARRGPGGRIKGEWLAGLIGLTGFVLFYAQAFFSDAQHLKYPAGDLSYYARLADHLLLSGQENRLADLATPAASVAQPYHWGDIWCLAMLARVCDLRAIYALPLVQFPLLAALFGMGLYRLLKTESRLPAPVAMMVAPLLLFTPLAALFPASWIGGCNLLPAPVAQYPKLLMYGIFACALLQRLRDREPAGLPWLLALAGLFYTPMLPLSLTGMAVIAARRDRGAPRRQSWEVRSLLLLLPGWLALLYYGLSGPLPFYTTGDAALSGFRLHPGLVLPVLANLAMLWPYALLLLFLRAAGPLAPGSRRMLWGIGILLFSGVAGWALTVDSVADSAQFFTNTIPLAAVGILIVCLPAMTAAKRYWPAALCVVLPLAGLVDNRSFSKGTYQTDRISRADYRRLQSIPAISRPWDSLKAVVIQSPLEPDRSATRASVIFYPLEFLAFEHPQYQATSLLAPFLADVPAGTRQAAESARQKWHTPLMQFVHMQGLSAVPPSMQVFWYVSKSRPDILIIANDAAVPKELGQFLGEDSVQLQSKPYRVLSLAYGR